MTTQIFPLAVSAAISLDPTTFPAGPAGPQGAPGPAGAPAPSTKLEQLVVNWDSNTLVANGTFIALLSSQWTSATILSCSCVCTGGSFTANIQINGVSVTGLSAVNVTSTLAKTSATGGNTIPTGGTITGVISGMTGTPNNAAIQLNLQTSFN
jgi:hypothetical protein